MHSKAGPEWRLRTLKRVQWASKYEKGYLASHFDRNVKEGVSNLLREGLIEARKLPPRGGLSYFLTPDGQAEIERLSVDV